MPPRRVSAAKTQAFTQRVGDSEAAHRHKSLVQDITTAVKAADESTLLAVKAMLLGQVDDGGAGKCFTRGIRFLGGPPPSGIPLYVKKDCLSQATGMSIGALSTAFSSDDLAKLFLYGINKAQSTPTPEKEMPVSKFITWWLDKYKAHGSIISWLNAESSLDWNTNIGCYYLVSSQGDGKDLDTVVHRASGERALLKNGLRVPASDFGHSWTIEENEAEFTGRLENASEGDSKHLAKLFSSSVLSAEGGPVVEAATPKRTPIKRKGSSGCLLGDYKQGRAQSPGVGSGSQPSTAISACPGAGSQDGNRDSSISACGKPADGDSGAEDFVPPPAA